MQAQSSMKVSYAQGRRACFAADTSSSVPSRPGFARQAQSVSLMRSASFLLCDLDVLREHPLTEQAQVRQLMSSQSARRDSQVLRAAAVVRNAPALTHACMKRSRDHGIQACALHATRASRRRRCWSPRQTRCSGRRAWRATGEHASHAPWGTDLYKTGMPHFCRAQSSTTAVHACCEASLCGYWHSAGMPAAAGSGAASSG